MGDSGFAWLLELTRERSRRLGLELCLMVEGQEGVTWPQWQTLANRCEQHKIPALFRSDHYLNIDTQQRGSLDAWGTVCALAACTSKLRLGSLVTPATFRHPSLLARLVVTADQISGGRVELGIGAGWYEREHEAHGFPFASMRVRMDILEEQLQILKGNWGDGTFSFTGTHYQLRDLAAEPKPVQRPHPPLIMGGSAGPRSAALAARFADEYNTPFPTLEDVADRRARVEAACEQAGRNPIPISVMTAVLVGSDPGDLHDRARRIAQRVGSDARRLLREPPMGWVVGLIPEAVEQLQALRDAGVTRVMCQLLAHEDLETVALIGDELSPALR